MEQRRETRHEVAQFPGLPKRAQLLSETSQPLELTVVNVSSCGMKLVRREQLAPVPQRGEQFEIDLADKGVTVRGMCVHHTSGTEGGTVMGIFVHGHFDQQKLKQLLQLAGC